MSAHLSGSLLLHVPGRHVTDPFMRGPNEPRLMELSPIIIGSLDVFSASVDEIIYLSLSRSGTSWSPNFPPEPRVAPFYPRPLN